MNRQQREQLDQNGGVEGQQDFDGGRLERRGPRHVAGSYPGPGFYPCGYYGPCYAYPGFVGFYDGWGRGPGFYGRRGFRY